MYFVTLSDLRSERQKTRDIDIYENTIETLLNASWLIIHRIS